MSGEVAAGPGEITPAMLRATFSNWRIFEREDGWRALRGGLVTGEGPRSLIQAAVVAGSLAELAERLSLQEWLRRMSEEELEAVWRGGIEAAARWRDEASAVAG